MRTTLLAVLALGLALGLAGGAAALPLTAGPVTVQCQGLAVSVDATAVPPTASATPPTCTVRGLPA